MSIYFASDLHLGTPTADISRKRELLFIKWLDKISVDASEIFLVGDLFDFWHEYRTVVPKGFVRLQGKIAALCDSGIVIHVFTGNHDLWMDGYLHDELGVQVHYSPIEIERGDKRFLIGHGDGLGPGDSGFKRMKKVFTNPMARFAFRWIHPDIGVRIAQYFSVKSRYGNGEEVLEKFQGEEKEWLIQYCKRKQLKKHYDYFIFGHRHLPIAHPIGGTATYINLGDWLHYNSYAVFNGKEIELKFFTE